MNHTLFDLLNLKIESYEENLSITDDGIIATRLRLPDVDQGLPKQNEGNTIDVSVDNPDQSAKIGNKIQNPYAVTTMKKAYHSLTSATRSIASEDDIVTTHLHVKFLPSNEDELQALSLQTDLELYLVPLDCEFTDGWSNEVDPEYAINGF